MLRVQIADKRARDRSDRTSPDLPDGQTFESLDDIDLSGSDPSIPVAFPELYAVPEPSDG